MSRHREGQAPRTSSFPRVSGDEPSAPELTYRIHEFSPRERG